MRSGFFLSLFAFASLAQASVNYTPYLSNPTNFGKVFHCDDGTTESVEQVLSWEANYRGISIPEYTGTTAEEKFEDILTQRITQHTLESEPLDFLRNYREEFLENANFMEGVELPLIGTEMFPTPVNCTLKQMVIRDTINNEEILVNKDLWDLMGPNQQAIYFIYFYYTEARTTSDASNRWSAASFVSETHNQEFVLTLLRERGTLSINLADGTLININGNNTYFYQDSYENGSVSLANVQGKQILLNNFRLSRIYQLQPNNLQLQGKLVSLNATLMFYEEGAICGGHLLRPVILENDLGEELIIDEDLYIAFDRNEKVVSGIELTQSSVQNYCDENFEL